MARERISTIKMLRPDDVWQPRIGAPPGNRNRLKTGLHTAEVRDLRRRLRAFHARVNALLKDVDERLKDAKRTEMNSLSPCGRGRKTMGLAERSDAQPLGLSGEGE